MLSAIWSACNGTGEEAGSQNENWFIYAKTQGRKGRDASPRRPQSIQLF